MADQKETTSKPNPNYASAINYISSIVAEFAHFFYITLSPISLILYAIICWLSIKTPTFPSELQVPAIVFNALLSGLVGTIWYDRYKKNKDSDFVIRKSEASIRNLQLIKQKISKTLERLRKVKAEGSSRDMEELESHIENIDKDILNSISDWVDVNPNSKVIVDAYEEIDNREKQILRLKKETKEVKALMAESGEKSKELEKQVEDKDDEIKELQRQINRLEPATISSSLIATNASMSPFSSSAVYSTSPASYSWGKSCSRCNRLYFPASNEIDNGYCNACNSGAIVGHSAIRPL